MLTRTLCSTISYNTNDFLITNLNELVEQRLISFWCFIEHEAEEDEKKRHKHLLIMPNGTIDTVSVSRVLEEFDSNMPDKPLKCGIFKHSQFADWYLYSLHDNDYLASKGLDRKYHYNRDAFVCSDDDFLWELVHTSDFTKWKKEAEFKRAVREGISFESLLEKGFIPIQQIYQYYKTYCMLCGKYARDKQLKRLNQETGEFTFEEEPVWLVDDDPQ